MTLWQCHIKFIQCSQKKCIKYTVMMHRVKIILRMLNHYFLQLFYHWDLTVTVSKEFRKKKHYKTLLRFC